VRLFPRPVAEEVSQYGDAGGRIRVLPPEVAHRIAAGEVIGRPASASLATLEAAIEQANVGREETSR
jgi:DNA mismatch repair protein MutL